LHGLTLVSRLVGTTDSRPSQYVVDVALLLTERDVGRGPLAVQLTWKTEALLQGISNIRGPVTDRAWGELFLFLTFSDPCPEPVEKKSKNTTTAQLPAQANSTKDEIEMESGYAELPVDLDANQLQQLEEQLEESRGTSKTRCVRLFDL
jgi:hypothetical protein